MSLPPTGTVTFLFTDIEGSTQLWESRPGAMQTALARHDALLQESIQANDGFLVKRTGDGVHAAFATAPDAFAAALAAQRALHAEPWSPETPLRVRMGLHTGAAQWRDGDYYGSVLNRAARLMAAGHGGQVLISQATQELMCDLLPPTVSLKDLGERRLKDLARPEHVFQILHPDLPADFPPLRSLDNPDLPNNLPQQVTSFVGREKEIAEVNALLEATRLLTLAGSGGAGKSRLSLQVAADRLDRYFDGVWLVELAPLTDPALVPQAVAEVFGVQEQAGKTIQQSLSEWLKPKRLLLILDNCEHLISACAILAAELLRSCPQVQILASSREPLNVAGEQTYRVPSLSLPDPHQAQTALSLTRSEAGRLFIERAQAAQAAFAVSDANALALAQVCRTLDGIPLAIELAAARVRALSVEEINRRLDNRFRLLTGGSRTALPRQQTLRALIDWSYDLLTESEKALLRRLSVFAGGWTLEAAEQVCSGDNIEDFEMMDLLTALTDKSLIVYEAGDGGRYRLLETVRQYAGEHLGEGNGTAAVRARHLAWCLALAEEAQPQLTGPEQGGWLSRLETEHDNLRAALAWCDQDRADSEAGLRLCGTLWRFWSIRGHLSEGLQWSRKALGVTDGRQTSASRGKALAGAGNLAYDQGDYGAAHALYEQGLEIKRQIGDQQGIANSLLNLGNVAYSQGDYGEARAFYEQSLEIRRQIGDQRGIANSLNNLGNVAHNQDDYGAARAFCEQSLEIRRQIGDQQGIADSLGNLGNMAYSQGDYGAARAFCEQSLEIRRQIGDQGGIADSLNNLGNVAYSQGQPERGVRLWGAAAALREQIGAPMPPSERQKQEADIARTRQALGDAAFTAAFAAGRAMTVEGAVEYALSQD